MKTFLRNLLLLTIFLIPLLGPYQNFGYEKIKVLFFILSTTLIGFLWLFTKPKLKWDLIKVVSLVFVLVLFITAGLGLDFRSSFLGTEPYFQGLILYAYLFLFSILVSSVAIKLELLAKVLAGSAIVVSLVAIQSWTALNIFNIPVPTYAGRVVSTFGQPNFYAGFLLLTLPFSYLLIGSSQLKLRYLGWGSGFISLIGILLSYSRSAIFLAMILLILPLLYKLRFKFRLLLVFYLIIAVLGAIKFSIGSYGLLWNEYTNPLSTNNPDLTKVSVEKRVYILPLAFKITSQKPLTGYGLENINYAFVNYFEKNKHPFFEENLKISPVLISLKELNIDRSHNYILDLLLFSGVLGLLGWLGLIGVLFWKLGQNYHGRDKNVLLSALGIYLIWIQFQNQSIVHLVYFWLLVGFLNKEGY